MLNMYLMSLLDESVESKIEKDENGFVKLPDSLNEGAFKFKPFDKVRQLTDEFINKLASRNDDNYTTLISDRTKFMQLSYDESYHLGKEAIRFATTTSKNIDKYKTGDFETNDIFSAETHKEGEKLSKISDKYYNKYKAEVKNAGKLVSVDDKKFLDYLGRNPSELKRFKDYQTWCKDLTKKITNGIYIELKDTHNDISSSLIKNQFSYTSYQRAVIAYCLDNLSISINNFNNIVKGLDAICAIQPPKPKVTNESTFLTEAAKDEKADDEDAGDDDTSAESEDSDDTNTDDNADDESNNDDDTNSDDENQDDKDTNDDENKDDNPDDDSPSDDDFSMDSDDPSSEDDGGENPDGLASPDAMGDDESTQDTETNVHVNILNLSKLDRTISLKRLLNDYTATRTSINTFLNIIDKNETIIDATLRESLINDLNSLLQNLNDYIGIKFSYINYEENLQNYIIFSKKLEDIVQRLQSAMQHNDK